MNTLPGCGACYGPDITLKGIRLIHPAFKFELLVYAQSPNVKGSHIFRCRIRLFVSCGGSINTVKATN